MLHGPSELVGQGCPLYGFRPTHALGPQHPPELTKSSGELRWGQKAIAVSIQGIKHILQVLQAEGQLLMEPLKTIQTRWLTLLITDGCPGAQRLPPPPTKARSRVLKLHHPSPPLNIRTPTISWLPTHVVGNLLDDL